MVFKQLFIVINAFSQTLGWIHLMHLEGSVFDNLLRFSGCLLLDPLRFLCYHLLVIGS